MKRLLLHTLLVSLGGFFFACQTGTGGRVPPDFSLQLTRTPCQGECPAYTLSVDDMGKVTYTGLAYTNYMGPHEKQMPFSDLSKLAKTLRRAAFFSYEAEYNDRSVPALGWTEMTYGEEGDFHTVRFRTNGPESFLKLVHKVEALIGPDGYQPVRRRIDSDTLQAP